MQCLTLDHKSYPFTTFHCPICGKPIVNEEGHIEDKDLCPHVVAYISEEAREHDIDNFYRDTEVGQLVEKAVEGIMPNEDDEDAEILGRQEWSEAFEEALEAIEPDLMETTLFALQVDYIGGTGCCSMAYSDYFVFSWPMVIPAKRQKACAT